MINFFIKSGDPDSGDLFHPYIWGNKGIEKIYNEQINSNYSKYLDLLLIMYYVEGKFNINAPKDGDVSNYSSKEKSISVSINIKKDFHTKSDKEKRLYIIESIKLSINVVAEKMKKKKLEFNSDRLLDDLEKKVYYQYLNSEK